MLKYFLIMISPICALVSAPFSFAEKIPFSPVKRIFNGSTTSAYPSVGILLRKENFSNKWSALCSGTLIAPSTFLSAGHCVCNDIGSHCQTGETNASRNNSNEIVRWLDGFIK